MTECLYFILKGRHDEDSISFDMILKITAMMEVGGGRKEKYIDMSKYGYYRNHNSPVA